MKKTIFIAGHHGMVGSALVRRLQNEQDIEIISKSREELDLISKQQVEAFFDAHHRPSEKLIH